jgi:intergrase/recombinase
MFLLASRYGVKALVERDLSQLLLFPERKRLDTMKAISLYAKFIGRYDEWIELKRAHGLKWVTANNSLPLINTTPFPKLVEQAKRLIQVLSTRFTHEIHFMALSGLRVEESLDAIKIFKEKRDEYLNTELKILEHFRYPHTFIRRSKKAFITVLDDEMIQTLENSKPITYNMLKSFLFRKNVNISLNYFRKIYATFLRQRGIEIEIIDLLQGRIPNNIFLKHYYRPELKQIIEKIRPLISELRTTLFY